MISKEAYTKIFLKQANISLGENTLKEYMPVWWKNTRRTGGLRLTDEGFECSCQGFAFHGYCKHSKAVLQKVEKTTFDNFMRIL